MKTRFIFILCLVALQSFAQHQEPNSLDFLMKERGLSQTLEGDDDLQTLQKRQQFRRFRQAAPEIEWNETKPHTTFDKRSKPHAKTNKHTEIFQSDELVQLMDSTYSWNYKCNVV